MLPTIPAAPSLCICAAGGNDLLRVAMADPSGQEVEQAAARLEAFLDRLPLRPVLLGNVYDPTFGDDRWAWPAVVWRVWAARIGM